MVPNPGNTSDLDVNAETDGADVEKFKKTEHGVKEVKRFLHKLTIVVALAPPAKQGGRITSIEGLRPRSSRRAKMILCALQGDAFTRIALVSSRDNPS